jgi:hypothetical protein
LQLRRQIARAIGTANPSGQQAAGEPKGHRNGTREWQLLSSFGPVEVEVPRARMAAADGSKERRSAALPRYARMTLSQIGPPACRTLSTLNRQPDIEAQITK